MLNGSVKFNDEKVGVTVCLVSYIIKIRTDVIVDMMIRRLENNQWCSAPY